MGVGTQSDLDLGLDRVQLEIPQGGLDEVLSGWSGQGQLLEALAAVGDPIAERKWAARDIRRRAHRILFQILKPHLEKWPNDVWPWIEALPAQSERVPETTFAPTSGTSWVRTHVEHGWPPTAFSGRTRVRVADTLLLTTLRWVLEYVVRVWSDARALAGDLDTNVRGQLGAVSALLEIEPVASAEPMAPSRQDVIGLASEGFPWAVLAPVALELQQLDSSVSDYATRLVAPHEELRWRLFHLGVLGCLLQVLREEGWSIRWVRPLSGASQGPAYRVAEATGEEWDLWFEAAGVWSYYKRSSPYGEVARVIAGAGSAIGSDLMLIRPGDRALIIECKYSAQAETVARAGYEQALAYAAEAKSGLVSVVLGAVVAPTGVANSLGHTQTEVGPIAIAGPSHLKDLLTEVTQRATS